MRSKRFRAASSLILSAAATSVRDFGLTNSRSKISCRCSLTGLGSSSTPLVLTVHLPSATYAIRDYSSSENPPILHRKEAFVDPLYENYTTFAELTSEEEARGLLSRPDIGFKSEWLRVLAEHHLLVVGHQVRDQNK